MHSVDRILPEFQHPQVGETVRYGSNRMRLERIEPERVLSWRSEDGNCVWSFVLDTGNGSTRLISRNRFRLPTLAARLGMVAMEPASLVMERKMLHGMTQRAEASAPHGLSRVDSSLFGRGRLGMAVRVAFGGCRFRPRRSGAFLGPPR